MPRLRDCHLGTTWLYNSAFISLTYWAKVEMGAVLTEKWL